MDISAFETFQRLCGSTPERRLYTIVGDAGNDRRHLTARETREATDAVAGFLSERAEGLRQRRRAASHAHAWPQ